MATQINPKQVKSPSFNKFYEKVVQPTTPDVKIYLKDDSKFMKLLNFFVGRFNKDFMTTYITTIGSSIYFPKAALEVEDESATETLAHEWIHVRDRQRLGILFFLGYLFPQFFALLALLGFFGFLFKPMFLMFLFVLFLAPLPAPFRMMFEVKAFRITKLFAKHFYGISDLKFVEDWVTELMTKNAYYYAWPFEKAVRERFSNEQALESEADYDKIVDFIKTEMKQ